MKKKLSVLVATLMAVSVLGACVPKTAQTSVETTKVEEAKVEESAVKEESKEAVEEKDGAKAKIGVIQLMEHTSLNIILDSFNKRMAELGYSEDEISIQNAQGDMANITSIVQTFQGDKKDVVLAITTPVAQGCLELAKETPVVFAAVTDPVLAGVVTDFDKTDKGMTGTSDIIQIDRILDLALEITPDVKSLGYIYNASEDNSVSNLEKVKKYAAEHNLKVEEATISTGAELQTAASTIVKKVDMIFCANDNTVAESMPVLMKVANEQKVPVYVGADSMVMDGGFATVGIDYTDLGIESANMVDMVLHGKKTDEINVKVFKDDLSIYVNKKTLEELGLQLPESVAKSEKLKMIE